MSRKLAFGLLFFYVLALSALTIHAQDTITSDKPIEGEITNDDYAIFYSYEGKKDDVIVIEMKPEDSLGDLSTPAIIIRDPKGRDLVRTDSFGDVTLVTLLPVTGEYTIIATRTDDASGTSVGKFTLSVEEARNLAVGDSISAEIASDGADYYVYREKDDFTLSFARDGEFAPALTVNTINDEYSPGTLDALLTVSGKLSTDVTLGGLPGGEIYVIKIASGLFDFNFETTKAKYTLNLGEIKK